MECKNMHFRHILLFYFHRGKKAAEAHKKICEVYGVDCLAERTCQNWFKKFRSGDFSLIDGQRSGRPSEIDDKKMKVIIESNRHITVREIAQQLNVSHTAVENHIRDLGLIKEHGTWVPNKLDEIIVTKPINRKKSSHNSQDKRPENSKKSHNGNKNNKKKREKSTSNQKNTKSS